MSDIEKLCDEIARFTDDTDNSAEAVIALYGRIGILEVAAREEWKKAQFVLSLNDGLRATIAALQQRVEERRDVIILNEGESVFVEGLAGERVKVALDDGALAVNLDATAATGPEAVKPEEERDYVIGSDRLPYLESEKRPEK